MYFRFSRPDRNHTRDASSCSEAARLLGDTTSLRINNVLHTIGSSLHRFSTCVDVLDNASHAGAKLFHCLWPGLPQLRYSLSISDPRHSCLMQHHLLQIARLPRSVTCIEIPQPMVMQSDLVLIGDPATIDVVETLAAISEQDLRWSRALEANVQSSSHLGHQPCSTSWVLSWKINPQDFHMKLAPCQHRRPPHTN